MRSLVLSLVASLALAASAFEPPEVRSYVASMNDRFAHYTAYNGPTRAFKAQATPNAVAAPAASCSAFWMETVAHQGVAAFNSQSNYQVFRNVKNYGAKGDGVADDTAAINAAISAGGRPGPSSGTSSTNMGAVVYFPAGTYLISTSIIDYYDTQIIGNANCPPTLKATSGFSGFGLIDGDQYQNTGNLGYGATGIFYRQVRNLVFDMTNIPGSSAATGIHWPTAQATSIQNCQFLMSSAQGTQHQGVFIESGSGGFLNDLTFSGGLYGLNVGNQQFTMRHLTFNNVVVAVSQIWDWGWTYKGLTINNCQVGLNMSSGGAGSLSVGAVVLIDSVISNTPVAVQTARTSNSQPPSSGTLVLENVQLQNVGIAVKNSNGNTELAGGTTTIADWADGHRYTPGASTSAGNITPNPRPSGLLSGSNFLGLSKPQYETLGSGSFLSVRSAGAKGDGTTDDTTAVQNALNNAQSQGKVAFFDAGTYRVTKTITMPAGSRVVGESYAVIMSSGSFFNNINSPQPVVAVGNSGQSGQVQWSDMIISTQGAQAGATLIQWNLASATSNPSGLWDVHTRIGGFIGSNLQGNNCPTSQNGNVNAACRGAYMSMHITPGASGLYMENVWLWTADHDIDNNQGGNQITIYTGRGLLCESTAGNIWMYGTAVEHHSVYQYSFLNTQNIVAGQIQTETPYYQPNPVATTPFPAISGDPAFPGASSNPSNAPNADAYGLVVNGSKNILIYGAGLYSFFDNYSTTCSNQGNGEACQSRILSIASGSTVYGYDLHTVGTNNMITYNKQDIAPYSANVAGFTDGIILFRTT